MPAEQMPPMQIQDHILKFIQQELKVKQLEDETITISMPFTYPYDDPIVLYATPDGAGKYKVSDNGDAVYWLNEVNGFEPERRLTPSDRTFWDVNCELYGTRRSEHDHLEVDATADNIGSCALRLTQTIIHILGPEPRYP